MGVGISVETFMRLPLFQGAFSTMFGVKKNDLSVVLVQYQSSEEELRETLWKEFDIAGMEIRMANTAFDYLIDCCELKRDLQDTLIETIRNCILMSGILYGCGTECCKYKRFLTVWFLAGRRK